MVKYTNELIADIKDKKELRALDDKFVLQKFEVFLKSKSYEQEKKKALDKLEDSKTYKQFTKSKEHDFLIKQIRAELRKVYGVFIMDGYQNKEKLLTLLDEELDSEQELQVHTKLLLLHKSTKERMHHYEELYATIFERIEEFENEKKVLTSDKYIFMDLACGLNPVSNIFFRDKIKRYYASDISSEDCKFLKEYFDKTSVDAIIFPLDLTQEDNFPKLKKIAVDICFIFKTLDGIERIKRNITEELLKNISTKYFAITFPTVSISGSKDIAMNKRWWFEKLLEKLGWEFEKFDISQELLYVVRKN
jgi:predicted phosphodiesterase